MSIWLSVASHTSLTILIKKGVLFTPFYVLYCTMRLCLCDYCKITVGCRLYYIVSAIGCSNRGGQIHSLFHN